LSDLRALDEARRFGFAVGGFAVVAAGVARFRDAPAAPTAAVALAGAGLVVLGWLAPRLLIGAARRWALLGAAVGSVVNAVLLGVVFLLVVVPIGLLLRLARKDLLEIRGDRRRSAWHPYSARQADPRHYERMA
jgi:hypothetical protein